MIKEEVLTGHLTWNGHELPILKKIESDFDVTWANSVKNFNTALSIYFIKPKNHISQTFGFEQELLFALSDYPSPEARLVQAVEHIIQKLPAKGRVDQTAVIIVSAAPNIEDWLNQYSGQNPQTRTYVGLHKADLLCSNDSWFLRNKLSSQLFSRDLFDYTLPLDSDLFFFGRQAIVAEHVDAIRRSENRGIFGLRKTGKTSILFKIMRQCSENGIVAKYYDCKLPSIYQSRGDALLERICVDLENAFSLRSQAWRKEVHSADKFMKLVEFLPKTTKFCLIFDEVENIAVASKLAEHWRDDFVPFWQTIWSVQSQLRRFSFLVAGVNAAVTEKDKIGGVQNPMFGIVKPRYLMGFEREEVYSLLNVFGKRMGLRFNDEFVEYIHDRYGGHPLLIRMICSQIHNGFSVASAKRPISVSRESIEADLPSREEEIQFYCGHITSELKEFYPEEYEMLEFLATDNVVDFNDLAAEENFVRHLKSYGLVDLSTRYMPRFKIPVIKGYIAAEWRRRNNQPTPRYVVPQHRRQEFVVSRCNSILREARLGEKKFKTVGLPTLYGQNGPPEAEVFSNCAECTTRDEFVAFINKTNRTLVEPIEQVGRSMGKRDYFFSVVREAYARVWPALNRVKAYRNSFFHLDLNKMAEDSFSSYLQEDLDGDDPSCLPDGWFQLQSAVLNNLLIGFRAELSVYD